MNNGKEKPVRLALAMCPKRSDAPWDLLPQNARTDFAAAQISTAPSATLKRNHKEQNTSHMFCPRPHWYSLLLLRPNPDLIIPSIYPAAAAYD